MRVELGILLKDRRSEVSSKVLLPTFTNQVDALTDLCPATIDAGMLEYRASGASCLARKEFTVSMCACAIIQACADDLYQVKIKYVRTYVVHLLDFDSVKIVT